MTNKPSKVDMTKLKLERIDCMQPSHENLFTLKNQKSMSSKFIHKAKNVDTLLNYQIDFGIQPSTFSHLQLFYPALKLP